MEKVIADTRRSKVIYDTEKKIYIKYFYPSASKKIKYFLGIRKYPGVNYNYISKVLKESGINVAEVVDYTKFSIATREVSGKSLSEELMSSGKEKGEILIKKYIKIVSEIINLGIYFGDFNFGNFMVYEDELYAIDLEDYRKDFFSKYRKKSLIKRLKRQLLERTEILEKMKEYYNGNNIFNEIKNNIEKY